MIKKSLRLILITIFLFTTALTGVMAAPEAIEKKTIELKTDTILINQLGTAGAATANTHYSVEYIDPDAEDAKETIKMYSFSHQKKLGTEAILKVDISSIKYASDFSLKFSFYTGTNKNNRIKVFCADYTKGENMVSDLTVGSSKEVDTKPLVCTVSNNDVVYTFQKTTDSVERVDVVLSVKDSSVLEEHLSNAVNNGEASVYFLVRGEIISGGDALSNSGSYFTLYTSASVDKAPSVTATGSDITSEVVKTESGYTYKVGNLKGYTDNVIVFVTAYDADDTLIKIATSGAAAITEENDAVDVDIAYTDAATLKAYIWKVGTLEPVTYTETISLAEVR